MLLPRFSIRRLLLITAAFALLFLAITPALEGRPWAVGMAMMVLVTVVMVLLYMATFAAATLLGILLRSIEPRPTSPFAAQGPPAPASPFSAPTPPKPRDAPGETL